MFLHGTLVVGHVRGRLLGNFHYRFPRWPMHGDSVGIPPCGGGHACVVCIHPQNGFGIGEYRHHLLHFDLFGLVERSQAIIGQSLGGNLYPSYPPPPLQSPGVARDGLPGGGGRRSPSDGVPGGGGRLQGYLKANCGTLH